MLDEKPVDAEEEVPQVDPTTLKPDLFKATVNNDTAQILHFLDMKVPPNHVEARTGMTPLHWAALNGNVVAVKRLLECGASQGYHEARARLKKSQAKAKGKKGEKKTRKNGNDDGPTDESKDGADQQHPSEEHHHHNNNAETTDGNVSGGGGGGVGSNGAADEEDDEEEDTFEMTPASMDSVSTNYLKNTPLLYATQAGHARVVWLLLLDGYSPNDLDKMDNNAVHLASAAGDVNLLKVLIQDGGNANAVNHYRNLPIDLAKNKAIRDVLLHAMSAGASLTEEDRAQHHEQNLKHYQKMTGVLLDAIAEGLNYRVNPSHASSSSSSSSSDHNNQRINRVLADAIALGHEHCLDMDLIAQAEQLLKRIEVNQDLVADILALQKLAPITTQSQYLEHVYRLEKSIEIASRYNLDPQQIQLGLELISRCQMEYWLSTMLTRVQDIVVATDANEHDMNKLRAAIAKAQEVNADEDMVQRATRFLGRFDAELGMYRALKAIPAIKLPMENAPEGYYTPQDVGKIQETEGFPLPPAETGEYVWIPAENLTKFIEAIQRLKAVFQGAEALGANPSIVQEAKERLTKAEKETKQLENKDANDKLAAIEVAKKAAKKLKAKNKKAKK